MFFFSTQYTKCSPYNLQYKDYFIYYCDYYEWYVSFLLYIVANHSGHYSKWRKLFFSSKRIFINISQRKD